MRPTDVVIPAWAPRYRERLDAAIKALAQAQRDVEIAPAAPMLKWRVEQYAEVVAWEQQRYDSREGL